LGRFAEKTGRGSRAPSPDDILHDLIGISKQGERAKDVPYKAKLTEQAAVASR